MNLEVGKVQGISRPYDKLIKEFAADRHLTVSKEWDVYRICKQSDICTV
jgi:hypothetical protein